MDFNGFQWISMDFNGFPLDFNGFQWISIDFNGFKWIFNGNGCIYRNEILLNKMMFFVSGSLCGKVVFICSDNLFPWNQSLKSLVN